MIFKKTCFSFLNEAPVETGAGSINILLMRKP